jgi:hypothetical protein
MFRHSGQLERTALFIGPWAWTQSAAQRVSPQRSIGCLLIAVLDGNPGGNKTEVISRATDMGTG